MPLLAHEAEQQANAILMAVLQNQPGAANRPFDNDVTAVTFAEAIAAFRRKLIEELLKDD